MRLLLPLVALLVAGGCSPRLSPPYRDYEVRSDATDLTAPLRDAAVAAGWDVIDGPNPSIVTTASREVDTGLGSRTEAALDLVPLSGGYVRVYIRAERRNWLGGRSKVYALDGGLREAVLGELSQALGARGLVPLGTPRDRDEDATDDAP